jgi:glycosyltransferase involved in cell wall biosynthesis
MKHTIKASLIIAVYKRVDFLELVFQSIEKQTFKDFEIIIAEDDCCTSVQAFVDKWRKISSLRIKHVSQTDSGFRKNKVLNKALGQAEGEFTVFIDGDCILHQDFLKEHMKLVKPNVCLFGRRVMLDADTSKELIKSKKINQLSFFRLLFTKSRHVESAIHLPFLLSQRKRGMLGCNFSVLKQNLIDINGFDEDFETPLFGEDTDVARRLNLFGVQLRCSKFQTIQYHLHHEMKDRDADRIISSKLYEEKVNQGESFCVNGYMKQ